MDVCEVPPKRYKPTSVASGEGETSSAMSKNDYEVFLSFRGPDTRQGLLNCIYTAMIEAGIVVFMDETELEVGDKINDILLALNNSQICVVVLSPKFAESTWCLREVERMVDKKKDIVPIFYDVTPDDVKLKTELYANALIVHENRHGKEMVQPWRDALREIPTIKGREVKNTGFREFSQKIVKEILKKLKVKHRYEIENFVEVPDELESVLELLDIGSGGKRVIGIHGMGGIGKTTLAKIIFNQIRDRFDCSCFLENIRHYTSQGPSGLHKLQKKLLRSLDPLEVANIENIQTKFKRKSVVIVLDDVDEESPLHSLIGEFGWFANGSRIIFTTRNPKLHEKTKYSNVDFYGIEKKEMDSKQALKFFCKYAFREDSPPKDFEHLSMEVISFARGIPLALQVVGPFLGLEKAKVWKDMIKKLKEAPHEPLQNMFMIIFDALKYEQQEIFLDIACFFIGEDKANASFMWDACKLDPTINIIVLISKSLIKLKEKRCFWMHDLLRDFGRAIVKGNARAWSRLWMYEDAAEMLTRDERKEKVEALDLYGHYIYLDRENFVGLESLRFLRLREREDLNGDFGGLIPKLRWFSLMQASAFKADNLCLRELVVLELSWLFMDETWPGWGGILISKQLKVLSLSNCHRLISTPDLSKIVNLERLSLEQCFQLSSIHSSLGSLQSLIRLSIVGCQSFRKLPEELTSFGKLKRLIFAPDSADYVPIHLPESINCLVCLTRLDLENIVHLHNSVGELVNLKHLSLTRSPDLRVLPDSIGNLSLLVLLDLSCTGITELPTTIGQLAKLESLSLVCCQSLQRLPDSIGHLHSLIELDMRESLLISELPHSFGNLASLQKLDLVASRIRSLPDSFRGLEKLKRLNIGRAYLIGELSFTGELPELPIGLIWLRCIGVHKIHNLSILVNLSELEMANKSSTHSLVFEGIDKLITLKRLNLECCSVQSLSIEWGALKQLKQLTLCCESLEFGHFELPESLESLDLYVEKCVRLLSLIDLSGLKNLSKLKLRNFIIDEVDLDGLQSLESLEMRHCILTFIRFNSVRSLRNLVLDKCLSHVHGFQSELSNLTNPSKLDLMGLPIFDGGLKVFSGEGLESLTDLTIEDCSVPEFTYLKKFRNICLHCCFDLKTTRCLYVPQLNHLIDLNIHYCRDLIEIQGIGKLKSLRNLKIYGCMSLESIDDLSKLNGLTKILIFGCKEFTRIYGVGKLVSAGTLSNVAIYTCKCNDIFWSLASGEPFPIHML